MAVYERVYDVTPSHDGTKGEVISNTDIIGENVFVSDSENGHTIRTTVRRDEICTDCNISHIGFISLPQDWIGRKVYVRTFEIIRG
jgi:hypothetical protein